jgi:hypothetical protein
MERGLAIGCLYLNAEADQSEARFRGDLEPVVSPDQRLKFRGQLALLRDKARQALSKKPNSTADIAIYTELDTMRPDICPAQPPCLHTESTK